MKHFIIFLFLSLALTVQAQTTNEKSERIRQELALDYSMPDFSISHFHAKTIGTRLAKILQLLDENKSNSLYKHYLGLALAQQMEGIDYVTVERFKIQNVSKQGDTISVQIKCWLGSNAKNLKTTHLTATFVNGVSSSEVINDLFLDLARYIQE